LIKERKKEKNLRTSKKKASIRAQKESGLYVCTECPISKKYTYEEMGVRKKDKFEPHLCKHHFEMEQKGESNRPHRERTGIKDKYTDLLKTARTKGRTVDIKIEEFAEITEMDCFYCGCKYENCPSGADRADNDLEYTIDNIVPSCKTCNLIKNTINMATFILMCVHIATASGYYKTRLFPQVFNEYSKRNYNTYKKGAEERKLVFDLSNEDFENLTNDKCYICDRDPDDGFDNGIDRINNNIGYTLDNCETCCGDCNFLKKTLSLNDFLIKCALIAFRHEDNLDELLDMWTPSRFLVKNEKKLSGEQRKELSEKRHKINIAEKYDIVDV
jgi:hypothetical protein